MNQDERPANLKVWLPLLFAAVMTLGMTLGYRLHDTLRNKRDISTVVDRNDRLEEIIDLIQQRYVDTVNSNGLYQDAVKGILTHLDPHTIYIPADEVASVNEDLEGSFFGIGVEFSIIRDTIQVTSVLEHGPADKAGLIVADKIIRVNDSVVAGNGITSERISKLLRGKQHTTVRVTLKDAAKGSFRKAIIERDVVPVYSVDAAILLDARTGYIKINRFTATTYDEFVKGLKSLLKAGATQLVIDLRDNPGGYLDAATQIADELLGGDKMLVYTQGIHSEKEEYRADHKGLFEQGRLAVLVDEGSASASEILAGAIQDWDRGLIIGRRSFGKGLVQEQYDLSDGAALRLTVARYYTPSGRSIQRSFANGRDAYEADFEKRYTTGELTGADSLVKDDTATFYTSKHRIVHGGGGIKPDVYVPYDTTLLSASLLGFLYSDGLQQAVWDYYTSHIRQISRYPTIAAFARDFKEEGTVLSSYLQTLPAKDAYSALRLMESPRRREYSLLQIKAMIGRTRFRQNGFYALSWREDEAIKKAIQLLDAPQYSQLVRR